MISYPVIASDDIQPLKNLQKVDGGFFISDEVIIELANYIQDLQKENTEFKIKIEALEKSLNEEREIVEQLLNEKNNIITLQQEQISDYKKLYETQKSGLFEKAKWTTSGVGITAVIILLANIMK